MTLTIEYALKISVKKFKKEFRKLPYHEQENFRHKLIEP